MKLPVPLPLAAVLLVVVGFDVVAKATPRAVTVAPPSLVILPPLIALNPVIEDADTVLSVATLAVEYVMLSILASGILKTGVPF